MLIDGDWAEGEDRFEIRSPATEELVATVAKGGAEHTDRVVQAVKAAHADGRWRRTAPAQRAAVLDAIADRLTGEKFVHVDLSGRLDRRACPLLLSTPPA
jgi:aldehyde dehydrogenase (NAD+)